MGKIIKKFDSLIIEIINKKMKSKVLDIFFKNFTELAGPKFLIFLEIILLFIKDTRDFGLKLGIMLIINVIIVFIIKGIRKRPRPYWVDEYIRTLGLELTDYSFPSGHTNAAFTIFFVIKSILPNFYAVGLICAILIGISRIYLGVHYPTDTIAGFFIAWIVYLTLYQKVAIFIGG